MLLLIRLMVGKNGGSQAYPVHGLKHDVNLW